MKNIFNVSLPNYFKNNWKLFRAKLMNIGTILMLLIDLVTLLPNLLSDVSQVVRFLSCSIKYIVFTDMRAKLVNQIWKLQNLIW